MSILSTEFMSAALRLVSHHSAALLAVPRVDDDAHLSISGLALNIVIDKQLHTVPLRSLIPVLNGNHRKAPLFVPADDMAPD
jgi:hypothetical protein